MFFSNSWDHSGDYEGLKTVVDRYYDSPGSNSSDEVSQTSQGPARTEVSQWATQRAEAELTQEDKDEVEVYLSHLKR